MATETEIHLLTQIATADGTEDIAVDRTDQADTRKITSQQVTNLPSDDSEALVREAADTTKKVRLDAGAVATATTRTISMPDKDVTLDDASDSRPPDAHTHVEADITDLAHYVHPNHTGDVTSLGDGAQTIANNAVTNPKAADMPANTVKVRAAGTAGDPGDVAMAASTILARLAAGDIVAATTTQIRDLLGIKKQVQVQARRTTVFEIGTATWIDMTFDTTDVETDVAILDHDNTNRDDFVNTSSETRRVKVTYMFEYEAGSTDTVEARVRIDDTTVVDGSQLSMLGDTQHNQSHEYQVSRSFVVDLPASSKLTLQAQGDTFPNDIKVGAVILIETVDNT